MSDKIRKEKLIENLVTLGVLILVFIFSSFIYFWLGYFCGWLAEITVGGKLAAALNVLTHSDAFDKSMLPMIGGALGWIGSFFKTAQTTNKEKK